MSNSKIGNYKLFIIQRGRQKSVLELFKKLSLPDYYYDFREWNYLKKLSIIGLLTKSFLTSLELPKNIDLLICEGSLCTFVGIFYKIKNPNTFLISYIIDPAFWIKVKSKFSFRLILRSFLHRLIVNHTVCITDMVREDGIKYNFIKNKEKSSIVPLHSPIEKPYSIRPYQERSYSNSRQISLIYIIDRPVDTAYTKGLDIVIRICDELFSRKINFKLDIYGFGTENLNFSKPWLNKNGYSRELFKAYENADLFLLPSRYDAISIASIEAISHGLIPLVSNKVGSKEFLTNRFSSEIDLVNEVNNIPDWVETINTIANLENNKKDEIIADLLRNIEHINLDNIVKSFNNLIYEKLRIN